MLNIGERITQLRKAKNWSQEELAKEINSSRVMIGKYERGDNTPSVEVLCSLAKIFDVTLDYLVGRGNNAHMDKKNLKRLEEIESLEEDDKKMVYAFLDSFIDNARIKGILK